MSLQARLYASERRLLRERSENGAKREAPPQSGEARKEYKYPIHLGGISYHNMSDRADELADSLRLIIENMLNAAENTVPKAA